MKNITLKQLLYNQLSELIESKITTLQETINSAKVSRDSDTKSSAGDKYETGRAMMHIEIEKNELQLSKVLKLKKELSEIDLSKSFSKIEFGCIAITSNGNFFLSIGIGKLEVNKQVCYAISLASPLGIMLQGKKIGDTFKFQDKEIAIENIV